MGCLRWATLLSSLIVCRQSAISDTIFCCRLQPSGFKLLFPLLKKSLPIQHNKLSVWLRYRRWTGAPVSQSTHPYVRRKPTESRLMNAHTAKPIFWFDIIKWIYISQPSEWGFCFNVDYKEEEIDVVVNAQIECRQLFSFYYCKWIVEREKSEWERECFAFTQLPERAWTMLICCIFRLIFTDNFTYTRLFCFTREQLARHQRRNWLGEQVSITMKMK